MAKPRSRPARPNLSTGTPFFRSGQTLGFHNWKQLVCHLNIVYNNSQDDNDGNIWLLILFWKIITFFNPSWIENPFALRALLATKNYPLNRRPERSYSTPPPCLDRPIERIIRDYRTRSSPPAFGWKYLYLRRTSLTYICKTVFLSGV